MQNRIDLSRLFNPRVVAIVGASGDPEKPGARLITYSLKHGYAGKIYPINPSRPEIMGMKAYPRITEVPEEVDVAFVAVPGQAVQSVVEDCAKKGVKFIVIFAAGFLEIGRKDAQAELVKAARKGGSRILGPNCQGVISPAYNMIGSYHACLNLTPVRGEIALVSQTGALGGYLCTAMWERGIGLSHFVSVGNESDLQIADFMKYFATDENTKTIGLFLEGVRNGPLFREAAEFALKMRKPIVALKTGRSEKGRISALTHTGAIAGSDNVYDGLFKQLGITRAKNMEELLDVTTAFSWQPLPKGNRAAFVSPSGAACSLVSDISEELEIEVADLSEKTLDNIRMILPEMAVPKNPLDVVYIYGNPNARTMVGDLIEIMAQDENVDIVIPGLTVGGTVANEIVDYGMGSIRRIIEKHRKPVLFWWAIDRETYQFQEKTFAKNRVPLYPTPERAVLAASAMCKYGRFLKSRGL